MLEDVEAEVDLDSLFEAAELNTVEDVVPVEVGEGALGTGATHVQWPQRRDQGCLISPIRRNDLKTQECCQTWP